MLTLSYGDLQYPIHTISGCLTYIFEKSSKRHTKTEGKGSQPESCCKTTLSFVSLWFRKAAPLPLGWNCVQFSQERPKSAIIIMHRNNFVALLEADKNVINSR
jgi:hypothetical protein